MYADVFPSLNPFVYSDHLKQMKAINETTIVDISIKCKRMQPHYQKKFKKRK